MNSIQKAFVEDGTIDDYFPKGDKRRGEVLAIIASINIKVEDIAIPKDVLLGKICGMKNFLSIATYQTPLSKEEKVWVDFMYDSIKKLQKDLLGEENA